MIYWIILLTFPVWAIPAAFALILGFCTFIVFTHWILGGKIYANRNDERIGYVKGFKFYKKEKIL